MGSLLSLMWSTSALVEPYSAVELYSNSCVDGSDNRLGKFLFQIIEATRGGMPARDGNRS
eukprot:COSAG01_NODE_18457_length_1074_cov_2.508718_3_plen_59_part_01